MASKQKQYGFFYRNALTITFFTIGFAVIAAQIYTGHIVYNNELAALGLPGISLNKYLTSGHFIEAVFENWESEFFQMAAFVVLTISLKQQGSSESKKLEEQGETGKVPLTKKSPWAARKGGWVRKLYEHSLSIALLLLFLVSFIAHFCGSRHLYNTEEAAKGASTLSMGQYLTHSQFWFESFQNWQSEFISVAMLIFLSIYLREKGSAQSKPVNMPHNETE